MAELDGQVTLITGAASGIGRGIANVLAREGADLVLADIDRVGAETVASDVGGIPLEVDVTSWSSCQTAVATALERKGHVDVLVNSAGVASAMPFWELDEEEWDRVNDVNAKGVFLITRAVVPHMMQRRTGRIVNIASMVGKEAIPSYVHYCASKFAVIAITQGLAKELAPLGITVNSVCPGIVRTAMWDSLLANTASERDIPPDDVFAEVVGRIPLGRPQEPEDIGEAVAFLASARARNVTGESFNVSGGQQVH
jgi:NAD(P)-dependent dehydrogenase (short-subunit alcohol dehydrogenase family)